MSSDQNGFIKRSKKIDKDSIMRFVLMGIASVTVLIIIFIILFVFGNSIGAIKDIGIVEFLTGNTWKPSSDEYGALPLITGTVLVTAGAILFALPIGLASAIFISEVAPEKARNILKPISEVFAGIPSVVYGFFGLIVLVPFLRELFPDQLLYGSSWLAGSILLGIMALPTIISVSEDALRSVPSSFREASVAMGATNWETTRKIVVPAAISGISAAAILGVGRAIGETMAVMMVTGNSPLIPEPLWNIFDMVRTITATLALEIPEVVTGSTHYSALFLLALILMIMVLIINYFAKIIVKRTKRKFGESVSSSDSFISKHISTKRISSMERSAGLTLIFVLSMMIISLFTNLILSTVISVILIVFVLIINRLSKKIRSVDKQKIAHTTLFIVMTFVCVILFIIIGDIVIKGLPALSFDFITGYPSNEGRSGGIYPAIVGTVKLIIGTLIIALPLGITSGVYLSEYAGNTRLTKIIRSAIDTLNGTPSVVFGLFGMAALVIFLGLGHSLIAGCVTLAVMVLPVITRTTEEAISAVPKDLREASLAMGASKWETTTKIVIPAAFSGILTGIILSLGRAAGETAPIMFTATVVFQSSIPSSIFDPVMALPYHLYYLAAEVPGSTTNQYGTALVLLIIVLSMFMLASIIRYHSNKNIKW
ncbi:MAG: phosphate ABC transporter permease subunit PstC [Candidatus Methanomethylophilaceae archaeon]|jgi:phosphate transport system permease protein